MSRIRKIISEHRGATTTEYSFIVALLNIALVTVLAIMSTSTAQPYLQLAECLYDANGGEVIVDDAGDPQYGGGSCSTMTPPEATR